MSPGRSISTPISSPLAVSAAKRTRSDARAVNVRRAIVHEASIKSHSSSDELAVDNEENQPQSSGARKRAKRDKDHLYRAVANRSDGTTLDERPSNTSVSSNDRKQQSFTPLDYNVEMPSSTVRESTSPVIESNGDRDRKPLSALAMSEAASGERGIAATDRPDFSSGISFPAIDAEESRPVDDVNGTGMAMQPYLAAENNHITSQAEATGPERHEDG